MDREYLLPFLLLFSLLSVIGRVSAIDGDNGVNGELSYSIQPSQYFAIDQKSKSILFNPSKEE